MRRIYIVPLLIFAAGLGLIVTSTSSSSVVSVLGLTLMAPVVRGLGLIVVVFSFIAFLAAYGSTLPPRQHSATKPPPGDSYAPREDSARRPYLSQRA